MRKAKKKATPKKVVKKKLTARANVWSASEIAYMRKVYKTTPASQIARTLKRSIAAVRTKARALGLKKPVIRKASGKKFAVKTAPRKAARKVIRKKVTRKKVVRRAVPKKRKTAKRRK
ncbi:MAG: histone [candidate division Zixibacteria bacterium]|nr:histone [candidate division Zixibacteria bacterium]